MQRRVCPPWQSKAFPSPHHCLSCQHLQVCLHPNQTGFWGSEGDQRDLGLYTAEVPQHLYMQMRDAELALLLCLAPSAVSSPLLLPGTLILETHMAEGRKAAECKQLVCFVM